MCSTCSRRLCEWFAHFVFMSRQLALWHWLKCVIMAMQVSASFSWLPPGHLQINQRADQGIMGAVSSNVHGFQQVHLPARVCSKGQHKAQAGHKDVVGACF